MSNTLMPDLLYSRQFALQWAPWGGRLAVQWLDHSWLEWKLKICRVMGLRPEDGERPCMQDSYTLSCPPQWADSSFVLRADGEFHSSKIARLVLQSRDTARFGQTYLKHYLFLCGVTEGTPCLKTSQCLKVSFPRRLAVAFCDSNLCLSLLQTF